MSRAIFVALLACFATLSFAQEEECTLCKTFIGAVEAQLEQNATEAEITSLITRICKDIPAFNSTCAAVAKAGVPQVIEWIEVHENATVVCQQLELCKKSEFEAVVFQMAPLAPADTEECDACHAAIGFMEHYIEENKTQSEIEKELEATVCKLIPNIKSTCDAIAEAGVPQVITWITTYQNSTLVCIELKICKAATIAPVHAAIPIRIGRPSRVQIRN